MNLLNPIEYSDPSLFDTEGNRIALKKYADNLVFYAGFDTSTEADYCTIHGTPVDGSSSIVGFGKFGGAVQLNQNKIKYSYSNFSDLKEEGSISFWINNPVASGKGYIEFKGTTLYVAATDNYGVNVKVGDTWVPIEVTIDTSSTMSDIADALTTALHSAGADAYVTNNKIRITSQRDDTAILAVTPSVGNSLVSLLGGVDRSIILNCPGTSTYIFDLYNGLDNKDRMNLVHTNTGSLLFKMYDSLGTLVVDKDLGLWSNTTTQFYNFEIGWNENFVQFFVDGVLQSITYTGFARGYSSNDFIFGQSSTYSTYKFDELIIFNTMKHVKNYTVETSNFSVYSKKNPYADIMFGKGYKENEVIDLNVTCSTNIGFVVKIGNDWWYYYSGSWRLSDGSYSQSCSSGLIETKCQSLLFDENKDLLVRAYFNSTGFEESWLENLEIIKSTTDFQAIITGDVSITTVDLRVNKYLTIQTQSDTQTVDVSSAAVNPAAVTMSEIIAAINEKRIADLAPAMQDSSGRLVLESISKGSSSLVSVIASQGSDAMALVFGGMENDYGEASAEVVFDYTPLFSWIRTQLGAPLVPVELTDEQLRSCLFNAVYQYNRWRNFKEDLIFSDLQPAPDGIGYLIPPEVGGFQNVTEIVVRPKYPFSFSNNVDDLMTSIYLKAMVGNGRGTGGFANGGLPYYYLTLSTMKDMNIILGTQTKWEIINGNLFIHPNPGGVCRVGIRYRSAVSLDEMNNNYFIRNYVLAEAKIILGTIRATFNGGAIPGGGENITLRGAELIAEGKEEKTALVTEMTISSPPLMFEFV